MESVWPLGWAIVALVASALATAYFGTRLAGLGDALADRLKWGEALFGAVFLGAVISLSGIVMTATAAAEGLPRMAFSNAVGGVAAQTLALGIADFAYVRANLEHAAASLPNLLSATLVIVMLTFMVLVGHTPEITVLGVHPGSLVLVGIYLGGARVLHAATKEPLWEPTKTDETIEDVPSKNLKQAGRSTTRLMVTFLGYGAVVGAAGWVVAEASASVLLHSGLDESFVGAAIMGITNALPEMVIAIAAVMRGAVTLAVGGVLGGNAFDVLNVVVGDVAYRSGSIFHAAETDEMVISLVAALMTAIILAGLLRRERHGLANVGFEGISMAVVYFGALALIALT